MHPPLPYEPSPQPLGPRPRPRLSLLVAWAVIALVVLALLVLGTLRESRRDKTAGASQGESIQFDMMAKYALGTGKLAGPEVHGRMLENLEDLAKTDSQKIKVATIAGELAGKDAALARLTPLFPATAPTSRPELPNSDVPNPDAAHFVALYGDNTPLPESTRAKYAPYSDLASALGKPDTDPAKAPLLASARRVVVTLAAVGIGGAILGVAALALFITAIVLLALGKLRFTVTPPAGPAHAYIEAFAVYLGLFLLGGISFGLAWPGAPFILRAIPLVLAVGLAAAWPLLRGGSLSALRQDWGLHLGRNPFVEILAGLAGYLAGIPIMLLGTATSFGLAKLANFEMSHPIQSELTKNALPLALLAVVFAPISEELLFRGAFLSGLRTRLGPVLAGLLTAFVFAAIHPQGWPAIPMLGSIGFVLALIRQWRGSLIAPITAHALNNGIVLTVSLLLLS